MDIDLKSRKLFITSIILSLFLLAGCGSTSTTIKKRNLEVNTQTSETIWVEPSNKKTVYITPIVESSSITVLAPVSQRSVLIDARSQTVPVPTYNTEIYLNQEVIENNVIDTGEILSDQAPSDQTHDQENSQDLYNDMPPEEDEILVN